MSSIMGTARGSVRLTNRSVQIGDGFVTGRKLRILCVVKTYHKADKDAFSSYCRKEGIDAFRVGPSGWTALYDCCGTEDSLMNLVYSQFVDSWEYSVSMGGKTVGSKEKDRERMLAGRAKKV